MPGLRHSLLVSLLGVLFTAGTAGAVSLGISPGFTDLGELNPGSRHVIEFYIWTDSNRDLVVDMISSHGNPDFFKPSRPRFGYEFNISEASEEYSHGWVEFMEGDMLVIPTEKRTFTTSGGRPIFANKRVTAVLNVPAEAEPGYHTSVVKFIPKSAEQDAGWGMETFTSTDFRIVFRVSGEAVRSGHIAGFDSGVSGEVQIMEILFKNSGTVTMRAWIDRIRVFGENESEYIEWPKSETGLVSPGSIARLRAYLHDTPVEPGLYNVVGTAHWRTGEYTDSGRVRINPVIQVETTGGFVSYGIEVIPFWFVSVLALLVFLGIYWWKR